MPPAHQKKAVGISAWAMCARAWELRRAASAALAVASAALLLPLASASTAAVDAASAASSAAFTACAAQLFTSCGGSTAQYSSWLPNCVFRLFKCAGLPSLMMQPCILGAQVGN